MLAYLFCCLASLERWGGGALQFTLVIFHKHSLMSILVSKIQLLNAFIKIIFNNWVGGGLCNWPDLIFEDLLMRHLKSGKYASMDF